MLDGTLAGFESCGNVREDISDGQARELSLQLSNTLKFLSGFRACHSPGQSIVVPQGFKQCEWWDDTLTSFTLIFLRDAQDSNPIAEKADKTLACMFILSREYLETSKGKEAIAVTLAEAFHQFCSPEDASWMGQLEEYCVLIQAYISWKSFFYRQRVQ